LVGQGLWVAECPGFEHQKVVFEYLQYKNPFRTLGGVFIFSSSFVP
jgi:hypothetical protein